MSEQHPVGRDNASGAYEEYLLLLQQRNRLLKKLKEKDEKQLNLERKEQGFSLYLNGANVDLHLSGHHKSRKTKTAGESNTRPAYLPYGDPRAKTAPPAKPVRKGWSQSPPSAIKIKTEQGDKLTVDVPGVFSGKYSDDFEVYQSYLESQLKEEEVTSSDEDNDKSDDEREVTNLSDSDDESDEMDEKLTFTVQDVKALRASLELDRSIMRSIASVEDLADSNTDSDNSDDNENDIKNKTGFELEEIEEEISEFNSSMEPIKTFGEEEIVEETSEEETEEDDDQSSEDEILKDKEVAVSHDMIFKPLKTIHKDKNRNNNDQPRVLESTGVAPKCRPVSSSKRRIDTPETVVSQDLLAAIAEENRKLTEYRQERETQTAPSEKSKEMVETKLEERPQTIANLLTDNDINMITNKVRSMNGRQQRKLLKMLAELEATEDNNIAIENWDAGKDSSKIYLQEQKNKRKLISEEAWVDNFKNSNDNVETETKDKQNDRRCSVDTSEQTKSDILNDENSKNFTKLNSRPNKTVEELTNNDTSEEITNPSLKIYDNLIVRMECLSNWGNKKYIGLTEIQFIDDNNKMLGVKEIVLLNNNNDNDVNNLINGKTKTTKGRFMWKYDWIEQDKVNLLITLPVCDSSKLSKIIMWNYNKSLQELNIGVKDICISSGKEMLWQGVVEKGCGNQIFDYSKIIVLKEIETAENSNNNVNIMEKGDSDVKKESLYTALPSLLPGSPINRPGTRTIDRSGENIRHLPVVNTPFDGIAHNKKPIETEIYTKKDSSDRPSSSKPVWLTGSEKAKTTKDKEDFIFKYEFKPHSRPSSGRRSQQTTPDNSEESEAAKRELNDLFDLNLKPRRPTSGRRSQLVSPDPDKLASKTSLSPPPVTGRQSPVLIDMPDKSGDQLLKSQRQKFKNTMDVNLEQSMRSIDNFKFHHLGRITANLDDDDDFGSLLEPMKEKDRTTLQEKAEELNNINTEETLANEVLFELPVLPKGKELIINIKTSWGDHHYVGLNGIEVFSSTGELIKVQHIAANPADINILPEYNGDPRVVTNLVDGIYLTRDDMHLWLTPFTAGTDHFVELQFEREIEVAMIRIWNYNKSRIHSTRGARFVEMALDGKLIFIGEINRASGVLSSEDPYGDTILFTMDEDILEYVAASDFTYEMEDSKEDFLAASCDFQERPNTADKGEARVGRPFTCPKSRECSRENMKQNIKEQIADAIEEESSPEVDFMQCKVLCIFLSATWGDLHFIGLTGLEVLGETFENIPLNMNMLEANPKDLNDLEDYGDDDRTLDKLINDTNVTLCDGNMWMTPFNEEGTHVLKITFEEPTIVTGIRVWNYNKSIEDTFRGAKIIHVFVDDFEVSPEEGFLLRKGPGHCHFDFAQDIFFNNFESLVDESDETKNRKINLQKIVNEYETLMMPSGFVFQLKLFSSWGDLYYIGLNAIEVYDKHGDVIPLSDNNITAFPHSVNVLASVSDDVRTPDKLVDGVNDTHDGRHMWLAPIFPGQTNTVYIVFDEPVTISMIKLWNYSKTPTRGVRQFGLLVDDLLVYSGVLPQCALYARAILPGLELPVNHSTILFTDAEEIALKERNHLLSSSMAFQEQNVQLTNERAVLNPNQDVNKPKRTIADPAMRPMTSVKSAGSTRR